jgi:hypothetical protein
MCCERGGSKGSYRELPLITVWYNPVLHTLVLPIAKYLQQEKKIQPFSGYFKPKENFKMITMIY